MHTVSHRIQGKCLLDHIREQNIDNLDISTSEKNLFNLFK